MLEGSIRKQWDAKRLEKNVSLCWLQDLQDLIERLFTYYKQHGFRATAKRILLSFRRALSGNQMVLFYCDLSSFRPANLHVPAHASVERKYSEVELDPQDLLRIVNVSNPKLMRRRLSERLAKGASLWLLKFEGNLVCYGWTLTGCTMEPHFYPLGDSDVHLFDFFVHPEYRGQRVNPLLVNHMLTTLASERKIRAFIEAAEWNTPQLHSLSRTPFQKLGYARKFCLCGRTLVIWKKE